MDTAPNLARQMWHVLEPLHAVMYYAPEVFEEAEAIGYSIEARWPSYFALRAAPLGPVGRHAVASAFYSFAPRMVAEHVPQAWALATPDQVLNARLASVDRAYRRLFGDILNGPAVAEAAALAVRAATAIDSHGRPLGAANADLPWPSQPHLRLWHASTILREARGDGHIAALLTAGLNPCEALVSFAAVGAAPPETFATRGWTEAQWTAASHRLIERGLLDADGTATDRGRDARRQVERLTDDLAATPWRALEPRNAARLAQLLQPLLHAVIDSGLLPSESTLGINRVAA